MSRPASMSSNNGVALPPPSATSKSPYQERVETAQQLEQTQKRKSRSETELHSLVRIRSTTPHMSPMEINQKDREIMELRNQISAMDHSIKEMLSKLDRQETLIAQQQKTIHTQSKVIENPRGRNSLVAGTPHRRGFEAHQPQHRNSMAQNMGTPHGVHRRDNNGLPVPTTTAMIPAPIPSLSGRHQSYHGATDLGSPEAFRPAVIAASNVQPTQKGVHVSRPSGYNNMQRHNGPPGRIVAPQVSRLGAAAPPFQPPQGTMHLPVPERPGSNPFDEAATVLNVLPVLSLSERLDTNDAAIAEQFDAVWACCRSWAYNHANYTSISGDNALAPEMKSRLIRAASMQTAFLHMKNQESRFWLVGKLMIQYVIKHILRPNTFSGLDKDADVCIESLRATMYQSTPASLRFLMLKNIADLTQKIVDNPKFAGYMEHLVKQRAEHFFSDIRSLKHRTTLKDQEDLLTLTREAHKLAQMISTTTDEYSYHWSEVGDRFDASCMNNIDPQYRNFNEADMGRRATIRLCCTPQVVARKNTSEGQVYEAKLSRMRVLLKVRAEE